MHTLIDMYRPGTYVFTILLNPYTVFNYILTRGMYLKNSICTSIDACTGFKQ